MSKYRKKRSAIRGPRIPKQTPTPPSILQQIRVTSARAVSWLSKNSIALVKWGGAGILSAFLLAMYQHLFGNVSLEFIRPLSKGYEFQLKNDTSSDRVVKLFRVNQPGKQEVIYKAIQDIYATKNQQGEITLPGGNSIYIPAFEFKELDGRRIPANTSSKFRMPPLSSQPWFEPEAVIVDFHYQIESSNTVLSAIDRLLTVTGLRPTEYTARYLVIGNYWVPSQSTSIKEAIRIACRDDDSPAMHNTCTHAE